ncbi:MAG: hypothetical protein MR324_04695 [Lachnospiraceae bacterium]|nr:hypothetical protein [Lachnospiraceae bacterium]
MEQNNWNSENNWNNQNNWNNGNNYNNNINGGNNPGPWVDPKSVQLKVTDVFGNLFAASLFVRMILVLAFGMVMFANDGEMLWDSVSYFQSPFGIAYIGLTLAIFVISIASIVFIVLDIIKINKAHYKITGLILFAIFLQPGYYLWRAYILKKKKAFPIIYTILIVIMWIAYVVYLIYKMMNVFITMMPMY